MSRYPHIRRGCSAPRSRSFISSSSVRLVVFSPPPGNPEVMMGPHLITSGHHLRIEKVIRR